MDPAQTLLHYHQATKHHYHRYARSAGYMDWANQPDPFRSFAGIDPIRLPLAGQVSTLSYDALFRRDSDEGQPLTLHSLGCFLRYSMALSAWKAAGSSRWSLRINPSSGNLHPTECYVAAPDLDGGGAAVHHYSPLLHALEPRARLPAGTWQILEGHFEGPGFLVGLSTITWRESWKYGERAWRYCNLDVGHALAALALACRLNRWRMRVLGAAGDDQIAVVLGLSATDWIPREAEEPDVLCWVSLAATRHPAPQTLPAKFVQACKGLSFAGRPNRLSVQTGDWPIITRAIRSAVKEPEPLPETDLPVKDWHYAPHSRSAVRILAGRRSAVQFDPRRQLSGNDFRAILERTLAGKGRMPFDLGLNPPRINLLLFVHRVEEVQPGLYLLLRAPEQAHDLRARFHSSFIWQRADDHLPLWLLHPADLTSEAMTMSCHQDIAGASAFAAAMLAPFAGTVIRQPYRYRHLHWECGMIGQVLYLEAEARGARGTGIGCYFDDAVHAFLGLDDIAYQVLYHFTVGYPVEDPRLSTLSAYHHLRD